MIYKKYDNNIDVMIGGVRGEEDRYSDSTISAGELIESDSDTTASISTPTNSDDPATATVQANPSPLEYMIPSHMTFFTIPVGTELFHGSNRVSQFNATRVDIGGSELAAFFSPNKEFASSYIQECATAPETRGYIHKFRVFRTLDRIYIISPQDKDFAWNEKILKDKFCNSTKLDNINGIGFFVPSSESEKFAKDTKTEDASNSDNLNSSEFALCNPGAFLEYVGTYQCIGPRQLSDEYRFDEKKEYSGEQI